MESLRERLSRILADVSSVSGVIPSLDQVYQKLTDLIAEKFALPCVWIGSLPSSQEQPIHVRAASGSAAAYAWDLRISIASPLFATTMSGTEQMRSERTVCFRDFSDLEQSGWKEGVVSFGFEGSAHLFFQCSTGEHGTLVLYRDTATFFPENLMILLEGVRSDLESFLQQREISNNLVRLNHYQEAAIAAHQQLLRMQHPQEMFERLVEIVVQNTDAIGAFVAVPQDGSEWLRVTAAAAKNEALLGALRRLTPSRDPDNFPYGQMVFSRTFLEQLPFMSQEYSSNCDLRAVIEAEPALAQVQSSMGWPLLETQDEAPSAVLVIEADNPQYFTTALRQLMQQLTGSLTLALTGLRLRETEKRLQQYQVAAIEAQQSLLKMQDPKVMLQHLTKIIVDRTDAIAVHVVMPLEGTDDLKVVVASAHDSAVREALLRLCFPTNPLSFSIEDTIANRVFQEGHAIGPTSTSVPWLQFLLEQEPVLKGIRSMMGWPILLDGEGLAYAALVIDVADAGHFTEPLQQLIQQLTGSCSMAMEQLRRRKAERHLQQYQVAAIEVQQAMLLLQDPLEMLQYITTIIMGRTDATAVHVIMPSEDTDELKAVAASAHDPVLRDILLNIRIPKAPPRFSSEESLASRIFSAQCAVYTDAVDVPWIQSHIEKEPSLQGIRSMMGWPILLEGGESPYAVLVVDGDDSGLFTTELQQLLRQLVDIIGLGLKQWHHRKVEEEQSLQLRLYKAALDATDQGVFLSDRNENSIYVNPGFEKITGYKEEEILGRNCRILQGQGTAPETVTSIRTMLDANKSFCGEILNYRKDGSAFWNLLTINPIFDDSGQVTHFVGLQQDITQRKQAEEALHNSEASLLESQSIVMLGSYVLDIGKGRWSSSPILDEIFDIDKGYDRSIDGWLNLVHPDDREQLAKYYAEISGRCGRFDLEYQIIRAGDGVLRWVHGLGEFVGDTHGVPLYMKGVIQDITEQKQNQEALRESEQKFHRLFVNAPIPLVLNEPDGVVTEINHCFTDMFGYSKEDIPTLDAWWKLFFLDDVSRQHVEEEWKNVVTRAKEAGLPIPHVERKVVCKDGARRTVLFGGNFIGDRFLSSILDITERKAMELALQQSLDHQQRLTNFNILLGEVNQAIARAEDETSLLQDICALAVRYTNSRLAWVGKPDIQEDFQVLAAAGETEYLDGIKISSRGDLLRGKGTTGISWREDRPVYVESVAQSPFMLVWADRTAQFGMSSIAALPIHRGGTIWAILKIYPSEEYAYPEDLHALMEELAKDIGFGLDRIDLTGKERAANAFNEVLLNSLTSGINVVRFPDRIIERVNKRTLEIFGATEEDLVGQSALNLYRDEEAFQKVEDFAHQIMEKGSGLLLDVPFKRMDGTPIYADLSGQELPAATGGPDRIVWTFVDVTERHQLMEDLSRQSLSDRLTDLPNRRALDIELDRAISRAYRNKKPLAVCMMDLDNFKPINDTYGHAAGDRVLQVLAKRLRESLRKTDFVARLGGDEFVLLIEGFGPMELLATILGKLGDSVSAPITLEDGQTVSVGLSMGVCPYSTGQGDVSAALLRQADQALYEAKAHKADRSRFWALYGQPVPRHRNRYQRLLWEGGLMVVYQPILDNRSGRIVGVEALARLKDEENHILPPNEFLPHLNEADIFELTRLVLLQSIDDLQHIDVEHGEDPRLWISVNLDPSSLNDACSACLQDIVAKNPIDPHRITFELLECGEFLDTEEAVRLLVELRDMGVRIALDDIGSSYSSLLRLKNLPVDEIKLDQGYVRTLTQNPDNLHFITTIQNLAENFGVDLVVEGAESDDILNALMMLNVALVQGYGVAMPMPLKDLLVFLHHPPIVPPQHPTSLLGLYAEMIGQHNVISKVLRKNPHLVNHATLADVNACPITQHLCHLGYPKGSPLDILHREYHRVLASGYTQWTSTPKDNDCRETKEAQSNLLAATLEEYHLALATSGKDWFVAQLAAQNMETDVRRLAM
jgi:diguanylate cyclase (GGDEF)-like protein/PAS domain S-box-containing protein